MYRCHRHHVSRAFAITLLCTSMCLMPGHAAQPAYTCPVSEAAMMESNFADVKEFCEIKSTTGEVSCNECICVLSMVMYKQLTKAGLDVQAMMNGTTMLGSASDMLASCRAALALQVMLTSGLSQEAFQQLGRCSFDSMPVKCTQQLKQLAHDSSMLSGVAEDNSARSGASAVDSDAHKEVGSQPPGSFNRLQVVPAAAWMLAPALMMWWSMFATLLTMLIAYL